MKHLTLILLACMMLTACGKEKTPLPGGVHMGMSMEEAAELTGGIINIGTVAAGDSLYLFGKNGLIAVIAEKTP